MKVIAFSGSPRKGGNTETLLNEAVKGAGGDARVFRLNDMDIRPCQSCGACVKTGLCAVKDDMQVIFQAIRECDRIIFASPVFFMSVSAQAKAMIDRCQSFWCEKYLLNKTIPHGEHGRRGLVILVGGMKTDKGMKCAEACASAFMRTVSVPEHITLTYTGVDAKGDIHNHPTALKEAFGAGRAMTDKHLK